VRRARHILVTGGAGFIGTHLCAALSARGDRVRVLDDLSAGSAEVLRAVCPTAALVAGDLGALDGGVLDGIDGVVHLAGRSGVRASLSDASGYHRVNVDGTARLLAAAPAGMPIVLASSSSVYGDRDDGAAFSEDDPLAPPASPYAASKRAMEGLAGRVPADVRVARLFTVVGPRQRANMALARFVEALRAGRPAPVYGDPSCARDYLHVADAVEGLLALLDAPPPGGVAGGGRSPPPQEEVARYAPVVNLAGGRAVTLRELVGTVADVLGVPPAMACLPSQPGDVRATRADLRRAAAWLGWRPRRTLRRAVEDYVLALAPTC
jgi:nucleoside-diphosphate-sugar epimerase